MKKNLFLMLAVAVSLTGCFTMVNRSNPNANWDYDHAQCENESMMRVRPVVPPRKAPSYTTNCSRSGNSVSCSSEPDSDGSAQALADLQTSNLRSDYKNNCLRLKGWVAERRN